MKKNYSSITLIVIVSFFFVFLESLASPQSNDLDQNSKTVNESDQIYFLIELADSTYKSDAKKANTYIDNAINIARENKLYKELIDSYYAKGIQEEKSIQYKQALKSFQMGLLFVENIPDSILRKEMELKLYFSVGTIFQSLKVLPKALEYYQKANEISEEINNEEYNKRIQSSFAILYSELGEYGKSNSIWLRMTNEIEHDTIFIMSALYFNICNNYMNQSKYDSVLVYAKIGLEYSQKRDDKKYQEDLLGIISTTYYHLEDYDKSLVYHDSAFKIAQANNRKKLLLFLHLNRGRMGNKQGNKAITEQSFINAYQGADSLKLLHIQKEASEELSNFYSHYANFSKAFQYQEKQIELSDSLRSVKDLKYLNALMVKSQFEIEQQKIKYDYQQKKNSLKFKNEQDLLKSIILALSLILTIVILSFFYLKQKRAIKNAIEEKTKQDSQLKQLEKIVTTNAINKIRISENIQKSIEQLSTLKIYLNEANQNKLNTSINELLSLLEQNESNEFEFYFTKIHPSFYSNLRSKFPNLSQNDLKLCAFIRLNLSTKQISSITNITPNSVKTNRARLRKKLNISNSDINLFSFLSGF